MQGPEQPANPKARSAMRRREQEAKAQRKKDAQKIVQQRDSGIKAGAKSELNKAFGGGLIGMRYRKGDTQETKDAIKKRNRQQRTAATKKLIGDTATQALTPEKDVVGTSQGSSFSGGATMKRRGSY